MILSETKKTSSIISPKHYLLCETVPVGSSTSLPDAPIHSEPEDIQQYAQCFKDDLLREHEVELLESLYDADDLCAHQILTTGVVSAYAT